MNLRVWKLNFQRFFPSFERIISFFDCAQKIGFGSVLTKNGELRRLAPIRVRTVRELQNLILKVENCEEKNKSTDDLRQRLETLLQCDVVPLIVVSRVIERVIIYV